MIETSTLILLNDSASYQVDVNRKFRSGTMNWSQFGRKRKTVIKCISDILRHCGDLASATFGAPCTKHAIHLNAPICCTLHNIAVTLLCLLTWRCRAHVWSHMYLLLSCTLQNWHSHALLTLHLTGNGTKHDMTSTSKLTMEYDMMWPRSLVLSAWWLNYLTFKPVLHWN